MTHRLSQQLQRRVALLSLIAIVGLSATAIASLFNTLTSLQNAFSAVGNQAAFAFDVFLQAVQSDLLATSNVLLVTEADERSAVFRQTLARQFAITELSLIAPDGTMLATRRRVGASIPTNLSAQPWYETVAAGEVYISPVQFMGTPRPLPSITMAVGFFEQETLHATLLASVDLTTLWDTVTRQRVGESGYVYIVDADGRFLVYRNLSRLNENVTLPAMSGFVPQDIPAPRLGVYRNNVGEWVIGTSLAMRSTSWHVMVEQPLREALRGFVVQTLALLLGLALVGWLVWNSYRFVQRQITSPLIQLADGMRYFQQGDLSHRIRLLYPQADEMNDLAQGTNSMASRLQTLINTLEERVHDRTRDLETAIEVSRQITTILDLKMLLEQVTYLTANRFQMYYVSVYLIDDAAATLTNVVGSRQDGNDVTAPDDRHTIALNAEPSLIARAARHQEMIVVNDTRTHPDHLYTALLPETRSEMAIPMVVGKRVLGVFDVQSRQLNRFDDNTQRLLRSLAEQVTIAVRNAQLFSEVQSARLSAERANQFKLQFLASVSHELRTPLNGILNFTQFVANGKVGAVNERQVELLTQVEMAGRHLLSLINDVLDISKIESGSLKLLVQRNVDLRPYFTQALELANSLIMDKPIELIVEIPEELPLMILDTRRVYQALVNLLSNACKFTEAGYIRLSVRVLEDWLHIEVQDTGLGISAEDQLRLFEAFQQGSAGIRSGKGTGLGLAITRSLIQAHGGALWLESQPDRGSTFFIRLPRHSPQLEALAIVL